MEIKKELTRRMYVKNSHGVSIRKGCLSCRHKVVMAENKRLCMKHKKWVKELSCCRAWEMSEALWRI